MFQAAVTDDRLHQMRALRQQLLSSRRTVVTTDGFMTPLYSALLVEGVSDEFGVLLAEVERLRQRVGDLEATLKHDNEQDRNEPPSW